MTIPNPIGFNGTRVKPSMRERSVLDLLCEGYTNPQIATQLHISINTVKTTLLRINTKLKTSRRAHVATLYTKWRHGLIEIDGWHSNSNG